jgi:hypothetical protein
MERVEDWERKKNGWDPCMFLVFGYLYFVRALFRNAKYLPQTSFVVSSFGVDIC